jgi:hypothetical protein
MLCLKILVLFPASPPAALIVSLPRSRLRLSSRGCHGNFIIHARGAGAGGCACRRAAIIGCHRRGVACRHKSAATPRHFSPCLPFLVRIIACWTGRACCWAAFVAAPPPLPPPGHNKGGRGRNTHLLSRLQNKKKKNRSEMLKKNTGHRPLVQKLFYKCWPMTHGPVISYLLLLPARVSSHVTGLRCTSSPSFPSLCPHPPISIFKFRLSRPP